jgi:RHS repeat-associated protein
MRGMRFGMVLVEGIAGRRNQPFAGAFAARSVGLLTALALALVCAPGSAWAEPMCTDTWTGASEGTWQTASNWSTGKVPGSSDVACIGAEKTVRVTEGANQAGVLEDKGTLAISGGSLELTNALEASSAASLTITVSGTLTGAGTLDISGSLLTNGSVKMTGSGATVILPEASATINPENFTYLELAGRSFVNEGTTTFSNAFLYETEGAQITNSGTFKANSEGSIAVVGKGPASIVNTGVFEKTEGTSSTTVEPSFENQSTVQAQTGQLSFGGGGSDTTGAWSASEGASIAFTGGSFSLGGGSISGTTHVSGATVGVEGVVGTSAQFSVSSGSLSVQKGSMTVASLTQTAGTLTGAGTLDISGSLLTNGSAKMSGSGATVILPKASATINPENFTYLELAGRSLVNEGTTTFSNAFIYETEGAQIRNSGTFKANSEGAIVVLGESPTSILNTGVFEKTEGTSSTTVEPNFENLGRIVEETGHLKITHPVTAEPSTQYGGSGNPSAPGQQRPSCGDPVNCATGNYSESQTDLSVGGRGVGLYLARMYNSQAAVGSSEHGMFGYGWTSSFSDHLVVEKASKKATLYQANGGTVPFTEGGGSFTAPAWSQDTLSGSAEAGYTLTLADQTKYKFSGSSGRLESVTDRDGNATTLSYTEAGRLEAITDPASRKITLTYNGEGLVESAKGSGGHVVKYTYEGGNLASVTEPGEAKARWQFKYDGSHEITTLTDGRGGKTINEYNGSHQVISQEDPAERTLTFEYEPFHTKITNKATGTVTDERFDSNDLPFSITRGYGTSSASTETFAYNAANYLSSVMDGNGHTTKYTYDGENNRTSMVDADEHETKWTYDSTHDVKTMTTPKGETTTITRESHGNPEKLERPAPGGKTQIIKYKYNAHGELERATDPLERTWKYEYNTEGNRTSETYPESEKRTWEYTEDSHEIATISPRGNVKGAKASEFTTKTTRDMQGRPVTITDPLGHTTKYTYDANSNLETLTDANGHKATYTYNADNQPTKIKEPNGTVTETEYDGAGRVVSQTDGNKHTTKDVRNPVGEITEATDPLGRKTTKEYDQAGNVKAVTDPAKRTTTYTYDATNRLKEISYSDGKTPAGKYEYDADGNRTTMTDGTGKTTYTYDQLDRLTESQNGHGDVIGYEYDLANEQTKITYPNGKSVTQTYDKTGRLQKVTDWLEHATKFAYNADSSLTTTTFPTGTSEEDKYTYDNADQMSEVKMTKGAETLASLVYTRDSDNQLKKTLSNKGLPGPEATEDTYDTNNRLTKAGTTTYEYDAANNATKIASNTKTYDKADELEKGTEKSASATYTYDETGDRTKTTPSPGPATTYGYDQAGNLTSVTRPEEGKTPAIKDTYTYDGDGTRASQTIGAATTYMDWSPTGRLPLLLNDATNNYIYGPGGLPIEQINTEGKALFVHHDQQGSTRMLTGTTGTIEATMTYDAYGNPTASTGTATTPLGYDGQYTSADTGLIYLRARVYDPTTAQFLTVDPLALVSGAPYQYAGENPLNFNDPTGLILGIPDTPSTQEVVDAVKGAGEAVVHAGEAVIHGGEAVISTASEAGKATGQFVLEHPVVLPAIGCTVGLLAGPAWCAGTITASYGIGTVKNIAAYLNGELSPEQLFDKQLLTAAIAGAGALPGLPLLGTAAGGLVEDAPIPIQLLVNLYLEGPDIGLGIFESNISCGLLGMP